jgi:hypothetical protein
MQRDNPDLRDMLVAVSEAFASFLQRQTYLPFSHKITGDKWGFIINAPDIPPNVQLAWKNGRSRVDLAFRCGLEPHRPGTSISRLASERDAFLQAGAATGVSLSSLDVKV